MITKECNLTSKQRLYTILNKECLTGRLFDNCMSCEYYNDESWCDYADMNGCHRKDICPFHNPSTCELVLREKTREWLLKDDE